MRTEELVKTHQAAMRRILCGESCTRLSDRTPTNARMLAREAASAAWIERLAKRTRKGCKNVNGGRHNGPRRAASTI